MDRAYVAAHLEEDRGHWWFRGRRAVLLATLRRALPPGPHRLLELGCGSGNVLEALGRLGAALRAAHEMLAIGGALIVAVPAYDWLWTGHDVVLGHRRRYTAARLRAVVTAAGLSVSYLTHFNTLLLPATALARAWKRWRHDTSHDLARPRWPLNGVLGMLLSVESVLVPRWPMPGGASLLLIGRR